jgi:hypothetical protein
MSERWCVGVMATDSRIARPVGMCLFAPLDWLRGRLQGARAQTIGQSKVRGTQNIEGAADGQIRTVLGKNPGLSLV